MRVVLQRVSSASVRCSGELTGSIQSGWLVLLGIDRLDRATMLEPLIDKILGLRLFSDPSGKFNLSLLDVGGELLVVSQFTLYADCSKGRRPSFTQAAPPEVAKLLYDQFVQICRQRGVNVATGLFGGDMQVSLVNDGPVTIVLDSKPDAETTKP